MSTTKFYGEEIEYWDTEIVTRTPVPADWLEARADFAKRYAAIKAEGFKNGFLEEDSDGIPTITDHAETVTHEQSSGALREHLEQLEIDRLATVAADREQARLADIKYRQEWPVAFAKLVTEAKLAQG